MATAFQEATLADIVPVHSGSMAHRLAGAAVPLLGGSAPARRRGGAVRRATFVPRVSERLLAPVATACLAAGGVALAIGVAVLQ
jgi:hypothetical protein